MLHETDSKGDGEERRKVDAWVNTVICNFVMLLELFVTL